MLKIYIQFHLHIYKGNKNIRRVPKKTGSPKTGISKYAEKEIAHMWKNKSYSTSENYRTAIRSFLKFRRGEDVPLNEVDDRLIEDYEKWLKEENISLNTVSCYMRSLRAIYNKAVEKKITKQRYPFRKVFTGTEKTEKRSIDKDEIKKLQSVDLKPESPLRLVRDLFLFSFYACGMPFVDVAFLKKSQIADGFITYSRHKTKQKIRVKLEPCMKRIIRSYLTDHGEYVFPLVTSGNKEEAYKQYRDKISRYNKALKILAKKAHIRGHLTSYVARHTWATLAYRSNVELPVISKALGHTTSKTTLIYVKEINNRRLDDANKKLLYDISAKPPLYKSIHSRSEE